MALSGRRLVLDTSAYSRLRTGHQEVLDRLAAAELVLVPVTVLGELEAGFELGHQSRENRAALAEFLAEPFVAVAQASAETARWYGRIFARLKGDGRPIPVNDVWIAAETVVRGGTLLTFDRHFERVDGLSVSLLAG